ncbi:MAG TPA: thiol:disulfide interchange protein [Flavobacteriales bacterium]|nr:thiol:disulfide interchange protein [Flavobacteriales bacterium]
MNRLALAALAFLVTALVPAWGQIEDPVTWEFSLHPSETAGMHDVVFHASVDTCWHIYSQHLDDPNGPLPTWFSVELPQGAVGQGDVQECEPIVEYDPNFMMDLKYFEEEVYWWQTVDLSGASPNDSIRGFLSFMVCDERQCLPPEDIPFALAISDVSATGRPDVCPPSQHLCHPEQAEEGEEVVQEEEEEEGLVGTFLLGFLLGLAALFTPCVFPMIPMTVSFFTKQSKNRADGIKNALLYGFFIIFIYTGLGLALTAFFGVDVLNVISTDPLFNVFLFALLLVFGFSFLGAFEIQLPSSWANKADQASDRGGILGIFFMAATLAIVSFSCTGPLVGSALAGAATGSFAAPTAVMLGFSIALALPFGLFAVFPGWLNSLPQSGGWLNSVKVVLGLVEIGFAFKFLSNADLVLQLGLLPRELFIAIWVAVSLAIAFYLFGWFTLPHDSKVERLGVFRFSTGLVFMMFAVYLVPGMWGAPVNLISGFPPPMFYSEWQGGGGSAEGGHAGHVEARFDDYDEGLAAARAEGKPMLLDFTGWACVNCRKMEEQVWSNPKVAKMLTEDVVLVSLYVDDRKALPEEEHRVEKYGGKDFRIRTVGNKWSYLQASQFDRNAQPFYVMIDHDGEHVGGSAGYDPDPSLFLDFLEEGLAEFKR